MKKTAKTSTSKKVRWRRRKDARPEEITHAALECFAERGFSATRLDDVAERAGVTKGTVYLYFSNKEELFKSVVRAEIVPNLVKIENILIRKDLSAADSLRQLLLFWSNIFAASRLASLPKLVISEIGNFPELGKFYLEEVVARGFALIGGILKRGMASGEFRRVDVESTVFCIISPALISVLWKHSLEPHAPKKMDHRTLFETHIDLILRGLANDGEIEVSNV
ncbi:MAG: TetR/AcrR family transcriptional regulator [Acidobacteria bacterium]|nr:TetR/AcrR family transcriptional regulator [Acidobacteriota bacterium]